MISHSVRAVLLGLALSTGTAVSILPPSATAQSESSAASLAYESVGRWLFDLYLNQSIKLTVATMGQARPDAPAIIGPQLPAIAKVLHRHRDEFVRTMQQPLRTHFGPTDVAALAERVSKQPLELDQAILQRLIAVDADFRRDGQKTIRAMTFDLGTIVAEALAAAPSSRQN